MAFGWTNDVFSLAKIYRSAFWFAEHAWSPILQKNFQLTEKRD